MLCVHEIHGTSCMGGIPTDPAVMTQYRTTVAKMLAKQANDARNPAQFIVTTFHPQIIHETDKVYGVSHQNRISR